MVWRFADLRQHPRVLTGAHLPPRWLRHCHLVFPAALCLTATVSASQAESLVEAMAAAYRANPALQARRLEARAADEDVAIAQSGYRPRIEGQASYGVTRHSQRSVSRDDQRTRYSYGLTVEQPLFDGFQTLNAVRSARSGSASSHEDLHAFENEILFQTATAYLDVLRDEGVVLYRRKNLTALRREMVGLSERLERGHATVTDIEQAKLRVANARSDLDAAIARLRGSELRFARLTGHAPNDLRMPKLPNAHLPKTKRAAAREALSNSPIISAARFRHAAAKHAVARTRGELLPRVDLVGSYDRTSVPRGDELEDDLSVVGRLRVPIYQGGAVSARVRKARLTASSLSRKAEDARQRIGEAVGTAWAEYTAAQARVNSDRQAVAAGERALDGVREEQRRGRRSVLDLLDAEKEAVDARIRLLTSRRDLHVGAYALLRTTGQLTLARMAPSSAHYDPARYARRANGKWWGTRPPKTSDEALVGSRRDLRRAARGALDVRQRQGGQQ